jgi:hypothetical protein
VLACARRNAPRASLMSDIVGRPSGRSLGVRVWWW